MGITAIPQSRVVALNFGGKKFKILNPKQIQKPKFKTNAPQLVERVGEQTGGPLGRRFVGLPGIRAPTGFLFQDVRGTGAPGFGGSNFEFVWDLGVLNLS